VIDAAALFDGPSPARDRSDVRPSGSFEPFFYGDYLWAATTKFVEFKGLEGLRKPLRMP